MLQPPVCCLLPGRTIGQSNRPIIQEQVLTICTRACLAMHRPRPVLEQDSTIETDGGRRTCRDSHAKRRSSRSSGASPAGAQGQAERGLRHRDQMTTGGTCSARPTPSRARRAARQGFAGVPRQSRRGPVYVEGAAPGDTIVVDSRRSPCATGAGPHGEGLRQLTGLSEMADVMKISQQSSVTIPARPARLTMAMRS